MIKRCTRIHREEQIASLIAAAGVIWGVKDLTSKPLPAIAMILPLGPLEICGVGILLWLHAKWRRSLKAE
ncbi:MAG: hypothetical protein LAO06_00310 [Acidobacteriia bacterium]|nr:hypothetical protein [Terriglobia bacterium]